MSRIRIAIYSFLGALGAVALYFVLGIYEGRPVRDELPSEPAVSNRPTDQSEDIAATWSHPGEIKALLTKLMIDGDNEALVGLSHHLSVSEISRALQTLNLPQASPAGLSWTRLTHPLKGDPTYMYGEPVMVTDSRGVLHVTFVRRVVTKEPDSLDNASRWNVGVYYLKRDGAGWSSPELLIDDQIYINGLRLLRDRHDTLYLMAYGHNNHPRATASGLAPGANDILMLRKPLRGAWTPPESCITAHPRILGNFDAAFDERGNLHLVWGHWRRHARNELRYRVRTVKGWSEEKALISGWNIHDPKLYAERDRLFVFTIGQPPRHKWSGTYVLTKQAGKWSTPRSLVGHVKQRLALSRGPGPPTLGTLEYSGKFDGLLRLFREGDQGKIESLANLPITGAIRHSRWSLWSVAQDTAGTPYVLIGRSGNLYLLRPNKSRDGVEAVCLETSGKDSRSSGTHRLHIEGNRLFVLSIRRDQKAALYSAETELPLEGWLPWNVLIWRLRTRSGLTISDRWFLQNRVLDEAKAYEAQNNVEGMVERYIYLLENQKVGEPTELIKKIPDRLKAMDGVGAEELHRQLRAVAERRRSSGMPRRPDDLLDQLLTEMNIPLAGKALVCYKRVQLMEVDLANDSAWYLEDGSMSAQPLANGNVLTTQGVVPFVEYDRTGNVVWRLDDNFASPASPSSIYRLDSGNTLVVVSEPTKSMKPTISWVKELSPEGAVVSSHRIAEQTSHYARVERAPNGDTLVWFYYLWRIDGSGAKGEVIVFDPDWTERWRSSLRITPYHATLLQNGDVLAAGGGGVEQVSPDGHHTVVVAMDNAFAADRLPNGNTLVAHSDGLTEYDNRSHVVRTWIEDGPVTFVQYIAPETAKRQE